MPPFGLFGSSAGLPQFAARLPGVVAPTGQPGGAVGPPPMTWSSRLALAGAALKDVAANVEGRPGQSNNVALAQQQILARNMMVAQQNAKQKFSEATNPADQRNALLALSNAGGDVSPYLSIMKSGRPIMKN